MKLGILTGGGDVPGLNSAIKGVVTRAASEGHEVLGIRRGWAGILYTDPDDSATIRANPFPRMTRIPVADENAARGMSVLSSTN